MIVSDLEIRWAIENYNHCVGMTWGAFGVYSVNGFGLIVLGVYWNSKLNMKKWVRVEHSIWEMGRHKKE